MKKREDPPLLTQKLWRTLEDLWPLIPQNGMNVNFIMLEQHLQGSVQDC
jgi:hypothetical protein